MNKEPEVKFPSDESLRIKISSPMLDCSRHGEGATDLTISVSVLGAAGEDGIEEAKDRHTHIGCAICYAEAMRELTAAYRDRYEISWSNRRVIEGDPK